MVFFKLCLQLIHGSCWTWFAKYSLDIQAYSTMWGLYYVEREREREGNIQMIPFSSISWKHLAKIPGIDRPDGVVKLERANAVTSGEPNNDGDCMMMRNIYIYIYIMKERKEKERDKDDLLVLTQMPNRYQVFFVFIFRLYINPGFFCHLAM